jgi:hypothetical protein
VDRRCCIIVSAVTLELHTRKEGLELSWCSIELLREVDLDVGLGRVLGLVGHCFLHGCNRFRELPYLILLLSDQGRWVCGSSRWVRLARLLKA